MFSHAFNIGRCHVNYPRFLLLLLPLIPILTSGFYMCFHIYEFSNKQVDWGAFGSFVGGVSGPIVTALTFLYLMNSNRELARQTSFKMGIDLINDHINIVNNHLPCSYATKSEYRGEGILKELLEHLVAKHEKGQDGFDTAFISMMDELEPITNNMKFIFSNVSEDSLLSKRDRLELGKLFSSKCNRIELKLLFILSHQDTELNEIISTYRIQRPICNRPDEIRLMEALNI